MPDPMSPDPLSPDDRSAPDEDAVPEPQPRRATGPLSVLSNGAQGSGIVLRMVYAACLAGLLVAVVALYSMHQAVYSRVEAQDHRIERLNKMLGDVLSSNANAEKIEKIEQQVSGIGSSLDELNANLKAEAEQPEPEPPTRKKHR